MGESIHREISYKLYIQLCEIIKRKIESKEWDIGFQIPTETDLCKTYGVSRATVRTAIAELEKHGYLIRQQGRGTFVGKEILSDELSMLVSFREPLIESGLPITTKVIVQTSIMPVDDLSIKLGIPSDEHVVYIKRLRLIEDKPVLIQETYVPIHICPSLLNEDLNGNSIFELFEKKYKVPITKVRNFFDVALLGQYERAIFDLPQGSHALFLDQHFFSWSTYIMYSRSIANPIKFKFSIELEKTP